MPTCTDAADKVLVIQYQYSPACTLHDVLAGIEVSHGRAPHSRKRRNGAIFPTAARVCVDTALHPRLVHIGQGPPVSHRIVRQDPRASDAGSRVGYHPRRILRLPCLDFWKPVLVDHSGRSKTQAGITSQGAVCVGCDGGQAGVSAGVEYSWRRCERMHVASAV